MPDKTSVVEEDPLVDAVTYILEADRSPETQAKEIVNQVMMLAGPQNPAAWETVIKTLIVRPAPRPKSRIFIMNILRNRRKE